MTSLLKRARSYGLTVKLHADGQHVVVSGPAELRARHRDELKAAEPEIIALLRAEAAGVDLCAGPGCYEVAIWSLTGMAGDTWCDTHRPANLADLVNLPMVDDPPSCVEAEGRLIWGRTVLDWGLGYPPYRPLPFPQLEDGIPVLPAFVKDDGQAQAWCVFDGCWHHHGGWGHRIAHCSHPESPYRDTGYVLLQVGLVCREYPCDEIAGGIGDLSGLPLCAEHWHAERFDDEEEEAAA